MTFLKNLLTTKGPNGSRVLIIDRNNKTRTDTGLSTQDLDQMGKERINKFNNGISQGIESWLKIWAPVLEQRRVKRERG